jgi:predicted aspartyl protease
MHSSGQDTPFQLIGRKAPLILLPSYVNGKGPYNFILDSGASHCLISHKLASNLRISSEAKEDAFGAGGAVQLFRASVDSVAVGSARQENTPFIITHDLEPIGAALKTTVDGAIGCNFMKGFRISLDYQRKIVRFAPPPEGNDGSDDSNFFVPFTFGPSDPLILLRAFANGLGPFSFALDTAAGRSVLSPTLASRVNVEIERAVTGKGIGGQIRMDRAKLDSLAVGQATVRDHLVVVGDFFDGLSKAVGAELEGVIGNNFLNQFHVTLDFQRNRLGLEPSATL